MAALKTPNIECDRRILLVVVSLMIVGIGLVASASSYFSSAKFDDPYFLLKRHLVRILIATSFLVLALHIDYRAFRKLSPAALIISIGLLLGLFVFGYTIRDSARWYHVKALQMTIQPAELARLSLVLFLAYWVAKKGKEIADLKKGFLPVALALVAVLGLMAAQPNYGSASATAVIAFLVLFLGGARVHHLMVLGMALVTTAGIRIVAMGYIRDRLVAFVNPSEGATAINWQIQQSLIGLGTGGVFGTGFGESRQKLNWLPDSHTDFIFSILGEEAGFFGTAAISFLFLLLALRALKISRQSGDRFGEMLAVGIGCSVFIYAALNMFVATGLFPVTGLPLPFLSYGGSALVVNAFSVGLLLNISRSRSTRARPRTRLS